MWFFSKFSFEISCHFYCLKMQNLNFKKQILSPKIWVIFKGFSFIWSIYVYFGSITSLIHTWSNIIDISCLHIFLVNPFELSYWSYDIQQELVDKPSIISYFLSTFCPTLDHHQGRIYYKSSVTFCGLKCNRINYSHHVYVWPSGKEKRGMWVCGLLIYE